jgi:hypothetical protein
MAAFYNTFSVWYQNIEDLLFNTTEKLNQKLEAQ